MATARSNLFSAPRRAARLLTAFDLALVSPPCHGPLVRLLERLRALHLGDGAGVRRTEHRLRLRPRLGAGLLDDRRPVVQVLARVRLARLRRERLGHDERVVTHPVALDPEVDHAVLHLMGTDPGLVFELLKTIAHLIETPFLVVWLGDAGDGQQLLVQVVVVDDADLGDLTQSLRSHLQRPGESLEHHLRVAEELADLADALRPVVVEVVALPVEGQDRPRQERRQLVRCSSRRRPPGPRSRAGC